MVWYTARLLPSVTLNIVLQLVSAGIFLYIEGWDFGTAMYHCMVTATTVGYGDVSIETNGGRMWAFVHILISVSLLAALLGQFGELSDQRKLLLQKLKLVKARAHPTCLLLPPCTWHSAVHALSHPADARPPHCRRPTDHDDVCSSAPRDRSTPTS